MVLVITNGKLIRDGILAGMKLRQMGRRKEKKEKMLRKILVPLQR